MVSLDFKNSFLTALSLAGILTGFSLSGSSMAQSLNPKISPRSSLAPQRFNQDFAAYLPPEYAPLQAMLLSEIVLEDENGYRLLAELLGARVNVWLLVAQPKQGLAEHLQTHYQLSQQQLERLRILKINSQSIWARDWSPLFAFSTGPHSEGFQLLDFRYASERPLDDSVPLQLYQLLQKQPLLSKFARPERREIPLFLEGGNLMCTRQHCFMSDHVLSRNQQQGIMLKDLQALRLTLRAYLEQQLWLVPRLPFEPTGHLDIWAKLLNENTLMVAEIWPESIESAHPQLKESLKQLQRFLDQQALGYDRAGLALPDSLAYQLQKINPRLKILRVPMPVPLLVEDQLVFRSYTNSLLVNGLAILPRYQRSAIAQPYPDRPLRQRYETAVEAAYAAAGYQPSWIEADYLIPGGGAWHCASMQIPALPESQAEPLPYP